MAPFYHATHIGSSSSERFEKAVNVVSEGYSDQGLEVEIQYLPVVTPTGCEYTALVVASRRGWS